ncbi:MAG TPA: plastocyanin/azurin family copper-binding protein [Rudaea sp.]
MRTSLVVFLLAVSPSLPAANFVVNVGGATLDFRPKVLNIHAGDTVTWINRGGTHNVEADDGSFLCARGCTGDGKGGSGTPSGLNWSFSRTFSQPGVTIGYFCELHGAPGMDMYGTIIVAAGTPVRLLSFDVD